MFLSLVGHYIYLSSLYQVVLDILAKEMHSIKETLHNIIENHSN